MNVQPNEFLRNNIVSIIPDLPEDVVLEVEQKLEELGVTNLQDFTNVTESDLESIISLKTVKRRLLIKAWKKPDPVESPPTVNRIQEWRKQALAHSFIDADDEENEHGGHARRILSNQSKDSGFKSNTTSEYSRQASKQYEEWNYIDRLTAFAKMILTYSDELREFMDPDFGLLDKLLAAELLNFEEITKVKTYRSYFEQNDKIIDFLVRPAFVLCGNKFDQLLDCLVETCQAHVANFLRNRGDVHSSHGDEKPLSKDHRKSLDVNRGALCECLYIDEEILAKLVEKTCVTSKHMERIIVEKTSVEKVGRFLDILRRRSLKSFKDFLDTLQSSHHSRELADALRSFTVLIEIHQRFTYGCLPGREREMEKLLCKSFKNMTLNGANKEILDFHYQNLRKHFGEIPCVQPSKSISVFIACRSLQSVKALSKFLEDGRLQEMFNVIFSVLASELSIPLEPAGLSIDRSHLKAALVYFQDCQLNTSPGGNISLSVPELLRFDPRCESNETQKEQEEGNELFYETIAELQKPHIAPRLFSKDVLSESHDASLTKAKKLTSKMSSMLPDKIKPHPIKHTDERNYETMSFPSSPEAEKNGLYVEFNPDIKIAATARKNADAHDSDTLRQAESVNKKILPFQINPIDSRNLLSKNAYETISLEQSPLSLSALHKKHLQRSSTVSSGVSSVSLGSSNDTRSISSGFETLDENKRISEDSDHTRGTGVRSENRTAGASVELRKGSNAQNRQDKQQQWHAMLPDMIDGAFKNLPK